MVLKSQSGKVTAKRIPRAEVRTRDVTDLPVVQTQIPKSKWGRARRGSLGVLGQASVTLKLPKGQNSAGTQREG